jgi:hypothetical protein
VAVSLFSTCASRTLALASAATHRQLLVWPALSPDERLGGQYTKGPMGSLSGRTIAERSLCGHVQAAERFSQ